MSHRRPSKFVGCEHLGVRTIAKVLFADHQAAVDCHDIVSHPGRFDFDGMLVGFVPLDRHGQDLARLHEVSELDIPDLVEGQHGVLEIIGRMDQPHRSLEQRLEHHHSGHDRKKWEMVAEIIFVFVELTRCDDPFPGDQFDDLVQLPITHDDKSILSLVPKPQAGSQSIARHSRVLAPAILQPFLNIERSPIRRSVRRRPARAT